MVHKEPRTIQSTINVAHLPDELKQFLYDNPKIPDATVYRVAAKYLKDPEIDFVAELSLLKDKKIKRKGASAVVKISPSTFEKRLQKLGSFNHEQIEKIMTCF